ncbi:Gfo/Idh/MocA family protein [Natrarchaeobius oligotrophus]|nr:Gfo/Idh/MocA family oxidoreductase [Natrarchaeobius chitinivorans]
MDQGASRRGARRETREGAIEDRTLAVGIVGCGEQMSDNLLPNITRLDGVRTACLCDIELDRAERLAKTCGTDRTYEDLRAMVEKEDLDIVVAASSPQVHEAVARVCLERDVNVFLEKPPARDRRTLERLIDLEHESEAIVGTGLNFRHSERVRTLRELSRNTFESEPQYLRVDFSTDKPAETLWELDSHLRSLLLATGIHALDIADLFFGRPTDVVATAARRGNIYQIVILHLAYGKGRLCTIELSSIAPRFDLSIDLTSENNRCVRLSQLRTIDVQGTNPAFDCSNLSEKRWQSGWEPSPIGDGGASGYYAELSSFVTAVRTGAEPDPTLSDVRHYYDTIERVIEILEGGPDETVPECGSVVESVDHPR